MKSISSRSAWPAWAWKSPPLPSWERRAVLCCPRSEAPPPPVRVRALGRALVLPLGDLRVAVPDVSSLRTERARRDAHPVSPNLLVAGRGRRAGVRLDGSGGGQRSRHGDGEGHPC